MTKRTMRFLAWATAIFGAILVVGGSFAGVMASNGHTVTKAELLCWIVMFWGFAACVSSSFIFVSADAKSEGESRDAERG